MSNIKNTQISNISEIWINSIKADGGAYKGCPKNDYCLHFYETGERPQNFIRDYDEDKRFLDYPKLNELIKRKNELLDKRATPAMYLKENLKTFDLQKLGKFDVILIDPPWEVYGKKDEPWSFEEIAELKIDQISDSCCFLFLWVGSGKGLDYGRALFKKWGFRRCEDIVWVKTNKHSFKKKKNENTIFQHTKEHCLVGIKGAVKRGTDRNFIHANIDTDVIVSEESMESSTEKPLELYRIIERFCLGRKRIELFGEDHNIRSGWLTIGKSLSTSNFDIEKYNSWFNGDSCYPENQGYDGGRFVGSTVEIENLRPKSPQRNTVTSNQITFLNPHSNLLMNYRANTLLRGNMNIPGISMHPLNSMGMNNSINMSSGSISTMTNSMNNSLNSNCLISNQSNLSNSQGNMSNLSINNSFGK